jgi:isoleucyl-tRNA synthetase
VKDLVRGIQNERKESGLEVADRITLKLSGNAALKLAWEAWKDYVAKETLAVQVDWLDTTEDNMKEVYAGGEKWRISLAKK